MKMKIVCLIALMLIPAGFQAVSADICSHVTPEWIDTHVPLAPDARIVLKRPSGEFCEVVLAVDGNLAPIYAGKSSLVAGRLFRDRVPVTRETMKGLSAEAEAEQAAAREKQALEEAGRKAFFKEGFKALAPLVSMEFGPGQATNFIYVVTDPNCSHCKAMMPELETPAFEAKLKLKLIIYPVLGQSSRDMTAHMLCKNFSYPDYREMDLPETLTSCARAEEKISATSAFFKTAGISFVPMVVASDGTWIVEGNDICQMRKYLGLTGKGDADCEKEEKKPGM